MTKTILTAFLRHGVLTCRPHLAPLLRYNDLLAENRKLFLPPSHLAPSFGVTPFEFMGKLYGSWN